MPDTPGLQEWPATDDYRSPELRSPPEERIRRGSSHSFGEDSATRDPLSPFHQVHSSHRTPRQPQPQHVDVVDLLPGKTRIIFACALPLFMIAATFVVQKQVMLHPASPIRPRGKQPMAAAFRHNAALLNRSCAPQVLRAAPEGGPQLQPDTVRLAVGAGFAYSGLTAVASIIEQLPGACKPSRVDVGFWSSLASESQGAMSEALLPPEAQTRRQYLGDLARTRPGNHGPCWLPWEISERYASVTRGGRALCVPFMIRHYFPGARILLMLAEPVQRAHAQQTIWLHNKCYRDASAAAAAKLGRPARMAKGAPAHCAEFGAQRQLRAELDCVKSCGLTPASGVQQLLQCASTCARQLRAAFPCRPAAAAPGADTAKGRRLSKGRRLEHPSSARSPSARRKAERRLSAGSNARPTPA